MRNAGRVVGCTTIFAVLTLVSAAEVASAQSLAGLMAPAAPAVMVAAADDQAAPQAPPVQSGITCSSSSRPGERSHCAADTSKGVVLLNSTGAGSCLLGKTWGYDDTGVWVADGCSGEFQLGQPTMTGTGTAQPTAYVPVETWGEFDPGKGFLIGRGEAGEMSISGYALVRYVNQMPGEETFTDHLGNTRTADGRNDIWPHRVMIFLKGWVGNPRLIYAVTFWTVLDTNQNAIFGNIGYQFSRKFSIYAGLNGNPGTRSLQGSHPFWLGQDRVMADEFFRPFFNSGFWAQGEAVPGLWYNAMIGDTNSILGVKSSQLDRSFTTGASMWWMPTTKEFGPRGAYGDWEYHDRSPPDSDSRPRGVLNSGSPIRTALPTTPPSGLPTA